MKNNIKNLLNQPKKVLILSVVLAIIAGSYGYYNINRARTSFALKAKMASGTLSESETSGGNKHLTLAFLSSGHIKSVSVRAGDKVKKDQVLATLDAGNSLGILTEAKAAYSLAEANYQKVINGATGPTIDVAKSAVKTAQVNLDQARLTQATLVENAYHALLNSTVAAVPAGGTSDYTPPVITGSYTGNTEGDININIYATGNGGTFSASGLVSGTGAVTTTNPQPIGNSGLFISFPSSSNTVTNWVISIPNKKAANYLTNLNAYNLAKQTQNQVMAQMQAALDQANATLTALVTSARPEDIKSAQAQVDNSYGALQIAESQYANTIIKAPADGTITSVAVSVGQIASANALAIEMTTDN